MPFVEANGIRIHYERTGGAKPALLLLHGMTDNWQFWPRVMDTLHDRYDLLMLDARGHGLSESPASGYTYDSLATDVAGVMRALGVAAAGLVGHSMGAMTAAVAAAHYPELVTCLVLEDPPWSDDAPSKEDRAIHAEYLRKSITGAPRGDPARRSGSDFDPWLDAGMPVSPNIAQIIDAEAPGWQDIVTQITCPTLLMTADIERGSIVTAQVAARATALNSLVQVMHIANAGHLIRRERFDDYMTAVQRFLSTAPPLRTPPS